MKAKRLFVGLVVVSSAFAVGSAVGEPPPESLSADLDGDGKLERITLVKFAETKDEGEFFQMRVIDDDGGLLWKGPEVIRSDDPLVFGRWHFGVSLPELAADIDGDGAVELVAAAPQSDVSPTYFRIARWKDGRFAPVRSGMLLESPRGSGRYPWSDADEWQGTWVSAFKKANGDGSFRVEVFEYLSDSTPRMGEADVSPMEGGFRIKKWAVPLKALVDIAPPGDGAEIPKDGIAVYRARLSAGDHFNSLGKRLTSVGEVLRQDRANYYKGNGDDEDGADPLFRTLKGRDGMEALRVVPVGVSEDALRETVMDGAPLVEVEVKAGALLVRLVPD